MNEFRQETAKEAAKRLAAPALAKGFKPEALHTYRDSTGQPIYSRIRAKNPDTGEKWIRPMHRNGGGFILGEPKFPGGKPLYNLHRIAQATPETPCFVVEGEKAADALTRLGILSTTSGGVDSVEKADWSPLAGRACVVWPDLDLPGNSYGQAVAARLRAIGCSVSFVDVQALELPPKGDADDWQAKHPEAGAGDVLALPIINAPTAQEPPQATQGAPNMGERRPATPDATGRVLGGPKIIALEIGELLTRDFPPKEPFLAPWLRRQDLAMVYAMRGVGKTHFCLALAYAVASGGSFLSWKAPMPRRVLYIDGEMPGVTMKERLAALAESQDTEPPEGYFRIVTPDAQDLPLPDLATTAGQDALAPVIGDAELIVLDNLSALMRAGKENEGEAWVPMATWALARRKEGRSVLFVHHAGKNGVQRGSSRREDLLDVSILLKHPPDYHGGQGARFEVSFEKARGLFGPDVQSVEATLEQGPTGQVWTWRAAESAKSDQVIELKALGMSPNDIATHLGIDRATVYRRIKKAHADGRSS